MGANVVVALNMMDEAQNRHISIDVARLSEILGIPVIPTVATRKQGMKELIIGALNAARNPGQQPLKITYQREVEEEVAALCAVRCSGCDDLGTSLPPATELAAVPAGNCSR